MNNPEFNSFNEAREKELSLKEIKESISRLSEAQREQLSHEINNQIIEELHRGLEVKRGDELNFLKALTLEGNTITWTDLNEANEINPGDIIKIEGTNILKNGNTIGNVTGFSIDESGNEDSSSSNEEQETTLEARQEQSEEEQAQEQEPEETQTNDTESSNESAEEQRFEVRAYSQDGNIYIIGENGEPEAFSSINMSEEFRESLEDINESNKIIGNFEMILNTLVKKDNEEYSELQNEFNQEISTLDISSSESIDDISSWVDQKNEEITGGVDLSDDYKVIEYIRTIDSSSANGILAERLFHETDISEEELQAFIENPSSNSESIRQLLGEEKFRELRESIRDKKTQADNYFDESKDDFVRQLIEESGMNIGEASDLVENQYKDSIIDAFVTSYAKNELLLSYVESLEQTGDWHGYEGDNKMMEMFSDIQGIGYLDASDATLDSMKIWSKEGFYIIGTQVLAIAAGAVTMGVGYAGVNAAVWGTRGVRGIRALQTASNFANSGTRMAKVAQVGRWGAMSGVGGASFYAGYGGVESMVEGENMYSLRGLGESVLFTGAFRALSAIPGLRLNPNIPLSQQKLKLSGATTLDAVAFSAIGLTLEGVVLEPEEWTAELILQAIVMAAAFRVAGAGAERLRFRKNGDKVEMLEGATTSPVNFYRHTNGNTYTRTLDGRYYNRNSRRVTNINENNLTRIEPRTNQNSGGRNSSENVRNNPNRPNNAPSESQRNILSRLNENSVINSITSNLNSRRKRIFQKSLDSAKNKGKDIGNGTLDFIKDLSYRGFNKIERGRFGGPLNVVGFKGAPLAVLGASITSWEELSEIGESINDKDADIFTWDNGVNLSKFLFDLTLFKQLGLIRGAAYNWALDEAFNYFGENDETEQTTE